MSTWNYRICKTTYKGDNYEAVSYEIREVYYNDNGDIWAITENAKGVYGEDIAGITECLRLMQLAVNKDVIDIDKTIFSKTF